LSTIQRVLLDAARQGAKLYLVMAAGKFSAAFESSYSKAGTLARREYAAARFVVKNRIPDLVSRMVRWFSKWLFIAFRKMADALAALTG
jgi:hypothetical protein